ncbi:polyhydroxyalkanoate synthase [Rhizobiales bacterium GAS188]|nr:polyhydroxyalkanoate synthase [Rhizobiales bacterium GAS188]
MANLPFAITTPPDPVQLSRNLNHIAERSLRLIQNFLSRSPEFGSMRMSDPGGVGSAFIELTTKMMADPSAVARAQIDLWNENLLLWQQMTGRFLGLTDVQDQRSDRRFKNPEWTENAIFDFIKQSYLISSKAILSSVHGVKGLDQNSARKVEFYSRQFVDAISPSNFVATNPEVLRKTLETGGENLINGLSNLLEDIERGKGRLAIKMTDMDAFRLGENLATTPGKVIYQNEMMQLIQYTPSTKKVRKTPLLIVPPWINKFYVLDLNPQNSFIRWLVGQGHTVFVISWVNPDAGLSDKSFEDYMKEGPLAALDAIEAATGEHEANLIGYCLGGTLLACTTAYLTTTGDNRIKSATYLVTMVDFTDVGDMAVFIDEEQLAALETRMQERGFLEARDMATSFNLLRANDLVWSLVVSNYLLGKEPPPCDLLFWNADSTRMPAAMHSFYLRKMYHENRLAVAGGITLAGIPIDLRRIETPTFLLSTREDHIAPWRSTYAATRIYKGPIKFVLSASGHIAGVISPPGGKYGHWQNDTLPETPDEWMAGATAHSGSWWPVWDEWVSEHSGGLVKARQAGTGALKPIEDAPGSYVRVRAEI